jgi:DUF3014 family protein
MIVAIPRLDEPGSFGYPAPVDKDNKAVGIGSALLVVVIGAGIYFYKFASPAPAPVAPAAPASVEAPAAPPSEPLPKLQESDGFIREKFGPLTSDPAFASWLKTDDLLSRFAAAVNMVGQGKVPKDGLSFMAPHKKFKIRKKDGKLFADPASYSRYDGVATAVGSLDAAGAAALFQKYKPLFQEAYQGLGEQKGDVQDAMLRAVQELLKTPVPASPAPLKEKGLVYAYVDDSLESLSPAQKQLLRMGPKNQAAIQAKLREFARALGVPEASPPK